MAKPILIIRVPHCQDKGKERVQNTADFVTQKLNNAYHVLVLEEERTEARFECYNDVNGLPDVDINVLLQEYYKSLK